MNNCLAKVCRKWQVFVLAFIMTLLCGCSAFEPHKLEEKKIFFEDSIENGSIYIVRAVASDYIVLEGVNGAQIGNVCVAVRVKPSEYKVGEFVKAAPRNSFIILNDRQVLEQTGIDRNPKPVEEPAPMYDGKSYRVPPQSRGRERTGPEAAYYTPPVTDFYDPSQGRMASTTGPRCATHISIWPAVRSLFPPNN